MVIFIISAIVFIVGLWWIIDSNKKYKLYQTDREAYYKTTEIRRKVWKRYVNFYRPEPEITKEEIIEILKVVGWLIIVAFTISLFWLIGPLFAICAPIGLLFFLFVVFVLGGVIEWS